MLSVNIFDPHNPFDPPAEYKQRYQESDLPLPKWQDGELDNKPPLQQKDYIQGGQGGSGPSCASMSDSEKRQYKADYYAMIELMDRWGAADTGRIGAFRTKGKYAGYFYE